MIAPLRSLYSTSIWEDPSLSARTLTDRPLGMGPSLLPPAPNPLQLVNKAHTETPTPTTPALARPSGETRAETAPKDIIVPTPRLMVIPQSLYRHRRYTPRIPEAKKIARTMFRLKTPLVGKPGVPLSMLANESEEGLRAAMMDADEPVLEELAQRRVSVALLRITWPAYPGYQFETRLLVAEYERMSGGADHYADPPQPISRLALAQQVAKAFETFVQQVQWYHFVSRDPWEAQFRFDKGALSFGGLWLVSLGQIGCRVFEAEVRHTRIGDGC
ncbi:hypothetical protein BV20DRAFT_1125159 [Pilatotrama ljubarskyi]|nr:hypothetical protein BV20DRAFT_1125159 [Pilatotrama ljubarskyi]